MWGTLQGAFHRYTWNIYEGPLDVLPSLTCNSIPHVKNPPFQDLQARARRLTTTSAWVQVGRLWGRSGRALASVTAIPASRPGGGKGVGVGGVGRAEGSGREERRARVFTGSPASICIYQTWLGSWCKAGIPVRSLGVGVHFDNGLNYAFYSFFFFFLVKDSIQSNTLHLIVMSL